jgi:hypothetical protein
MKVAMFSQLRKRDKHCCRERDNLPAVADKMARLPILMVIECNPLRVNV